MNTRARPMNTRAAPVAVVILLALALGAGLRLGWSAPIAADPADPADAPPDSLAAAELQWRFPVVVHDDPSGANQTDPALVADPVGGLYAAWVDHRLGDAAGAIYFARLAPGASQWEQNRRVVGGDAATNRADPALAVDSFGNVHLVWAETRSGDPDIYHSVLPVGTRLWSTPVRVNDDAGAAVQWAPALAADPYGNVHAIWADYRSGSADIYHTRRLAGGAWSANSRVNNPADGDQRAPALTATKTGDLVAVWEDTRAGRADIYASRLPPGGDVWWPNGRLSQAEDHGLSRGPSVGSDSTGQVHALWVDEGAGGAGGLRAATLLDPGRFWENDRVVYQPSRGSLLRAAIAGGPGGRVLAVWSETRPDETRLYSGLLAPDSRLVATRVDVSPIIGDSDDPVLAIDPAARAHLLWQADDPAGRRDILYSQTDLGAPAYPPVTASGWLQYRVRQFNCGTDGFVTILCDGAPDRLIFPREVDLAPFLGSFVTLSGYAVADTACAHMVATSVHFKTSPCPRQASSVTAVLTDRGLPVEGARVRLADMEVSTGPSGRFFFDGLAPGAMYTVTATLPCALTVRIGPLRASGGLNMLPAGAFARGDVNADCVIDVFDLAAAAGQYQAPGPFFPACSDVDGDGTVGMADLSIIAANYDAACPAPWQGVR
jgi:hypothetical protein